MKGVDLSRVDLSRVDLSRVRNPVLDREPHVSARDPALFIHRGALHCVHTAVEHREGRYRLYLDESRSAGLVHWSEPRRLTTSELNYSSPGNVFRADGRWYMCLQSYPMGPGERYGNETCRLWLMDSADLEAWSEPRVMAAEGCRAAWCRSTRQIDPYVVVHEGRYWCFYKAHGRLGLLVSEDLVAWEEALPDRPVLGPEQMPDGAAVENPCVVWDGDAFRMFFAPCRPGRGIGVARSSDLLHWRDVRYLDWPLLPWAPGGPTAAMVLDAREELGVWLMAFHGEGEGHAHTAALGLAWSEDLETWQVP